MFNKFPVWDCLKYPPGFSTMASGPGWSTAGKVDAGKARAF